MKTKQIKINEEFFNRKETWLKALLEAKKADWSKDPKIGD